MLVFDFGSFLDIQLEFSGLAVQSSKSPHTCLNQTMPNESELIKLFKSLNYVPWKRTSIKLNDDPLASLPPPPHQIHSTKP